MEIIAFGLGLFLLALTFWDLFQTIVVPRPGQCKCISQSIGTFPAGPGVG